MSPMRGAVFGLPRSQARSLFSLCQEAEAVGSTDEPAKAVAIATLRSPSTQPAIQRSQQIRAQPVITSTE